MHLLDLLHTFKYSFNARYGTYAAHIICIALGDINLT